MLVTLKDVRHARYIGDPASITNQVYWYAYLQSGMDGVAVTTKVDEIVLGRTPCVTIGSLNIYRTIEQILGVVGPACPAPAQRDNIWSNAINGLDAWAEGVYI